MNDNELPEGAITVEQFNKRVGNGEALAVLDDYVIDMTKFLNEHPGGRFSLEQNIGRDISKFFYGAYSLENIDVVEPHNHTSDARLIVNALIIGKLEGMVSSKLMRA